MKKLLEEPTVPKEERYRVAAQLVSKLDAMRKEADKNERELIISTVKAACPFKKGDIVRDVTTGETLCLVASSNLYYHDGVDVLFKCELLKNDGTKRKVLLEKRIMMSRMKLIKSSEAV